MITKRRPFYSAVLAATVIALIWTGGRIHRFWSIRQLQDSGLWAIKFYPNHQGLSNADFPIPDWGIRCVGFLYGKGRYQGEWLRDGPAIASLFQPVDHMSFTATEQGMKSSTKTISHFRHLNSLRIYFNPNDTGPIADRSMQTFFEQLAKMKQLRSLTLADFPPGHTDALRQLGKHAHLSNLYITFNEADDLKWAGELASLTSLHISVPDDDFTEEWGWLKGLARLQSFSLNLSYEVDVHRIRSRLPENCTFTLNGVTFSSELWPGL